MKSEIRFHPLHKKCLFLQNGTVEVGVALEFGLRIVHFSFAGEVNVFFEQPEEMTRFTNERGWRIRGGHRLWLAPERQEDYEPDNEPVEWEEKENSFLFTQKEDKALGVIKSFEIALDGNRVTVTHRAKNTKDSGQRFSLWALTVMKPGGTLTIPLKEREGGMDPLHRLSFWDYTDLGDGRIRFEKDRIRIEQRKAERNLKIGLGHPKSAPTYENGGTVFYKHVPFFEGEAYPDGDVSFEVFVSDFMTEIEGLSPLYALKPAETAAYTEIWELRRKTKEGET